MDKMQNNSLTSRTLALKQKFMETLIGKSLTLSGLLFILLIFSIFMTLLFGAFPALRAFGLKFIFNSTWDPVAENFGALPFIVGTLITSFLALIFSLPFSLSLSLFLGEYFKDGILASIVQGAIELLAGVPSVIYGFWALYILVPIIQKIELGIGVAPYGVGILTASLILSVMIIPFSASIGREAVKMVPQDLKEAAYSLGATRIEVIKEVILPFSGSGIFAGFLLSLGRAIGETMAVTMVIGNSYFLPKSIFDPSNTMASLIANEFTEATGELYISSLIEIGLLLILITVVINLIGLFVIKRLSRQR